MGPTPEDVIRKTQEDAAAADAKAALDAKAAKEKAEGQAGDGTTTTATATEEKPTGETTTPAPTEAGAATTGEVQTEEKAGDKLPVISKELAQARIDRMYARLQTERAKNTGRVTLPVDTNGDEDDKPKGITAEQAEAIWSRKENERKFKESETKVLMRHATALNEDGTFNLNDSFARAYIDVGKNNQSLCFMVNGPELAEALVEKQLGLSYKQGARDANAGTIAANNAHTGTSTVATTGAAILQLPDVKKKIARRMNMTEVQYAEYEVKIAKGDKRVR